MNDKIPHPYARLKDGRTVYIKEYNRSEDTFVGVNAITHDNQSIKFHSSDIERYADEICKVVSID